MSKMNLNEEKQWLVNGIFSRISDSLFRPILCHCLNRLKISIFSFPKNLNSFHREYIWRENVEKGIRSSLGLFATFLILPIGFDLWNINNGCELWFMGTLVSFWFLSTWKISLFECTRPTRHGFRAFS